MINTTKCGIFFLHFIQIRNKNKTIQWKIFRKSSENMWHPRSLFYAWARCDCVLILLTHCFIFESVVLFYLFQFWVGWYDRIWIQSGAVFIFRPSDFDFGGMSNGWKTILKSSSCVELTRNRRFVIYTEYFQGRRIFWVGAIDLSR